MSDITPAASVLLSRGPGSREIFAILRGAHLKFFGHFWAFPGGKLAPDDAYRGDALHARRVAACRELFEETGVLIARRPDGSFPHPSPDLDACRHALLNEQLSFREMLADRSLQIHDEDFAVIGEITTPAFSPLRYATTFFIAHLPTNQTPVIWPGELETGEWIDGPTLLGRWRRGECLLTPPTVMTLETLGNRAIEDMPQLLGPLFERLCAGAIHPIFFAPRLQMVPLRTASLPPSAYTNAIIIGSGPRYLIDPGPDDPVEQQGLFTLIEEHAQAGQPLTAIILSHHHPDHIGAAAVCAERYRLPTWAHAETAERLRGRVTVDRLLKDGERLELGLAPSDRHTLHLDVMHTPGHASGHLAFFEPHYRILLAGDMISTMTSIVVAPPDGDLAVYLHSLRRLRELPARMLIPAHGNVSTQPRRTIDDALEHRAKRERQLLEALADGAATIDELTIRNYRGTPEALMRFARAQTLAGLLKLQHEGKAAPADAERWRRL